MWQWHSEVGKNVCKMLCHQQSLHSPSLLVALPPSFLCHVFAVCATSVAASVTVLWWDTVPTVGCVVSLCCWLQVVHSFLGAFFAHTAISKLCVFEPQHTAVSGNRSIFWWSAMHSRLYHLVAEGEAYFWRDVGEGWTRRRWGEEEEMRRRWGEMRACECERGRGEVDAHAEGGA